MTTAKCYECLEAKPLDQFYKTPSAKGNRKVHAWCKKCCSLKNKERYDSSPAVRRRALGRVVFKRFGIALELYEDLLKGACDVCGSKDRLCLDHDHETTFIRGTLCSNCNRGLGLLGDDLDRLKGAVEYLTLHNNNKNEGEK